MVNAISYTLYIPVDLKLHARSTLIDNKQRGSFACTTHFVTRFKDTSEDPWHQHLLSSVWRWNRLGSIGIRTPTSYMQGECYNKLRSISISILLIHLRHQQETFAWSTRLMSREGIHVYNMPCLWHWFRAFVKSFGEHAVSLTMSKGCGEQTRII